MPFCNKFPPRLLCLHWKGCLWKGAGQTAETHCIFEVAFNDWGMEDISLDWTKEILYSQGEKKESTDEISRRIRCFPWKPLSYIEGQFCLIGQPLSLTLGFHAGQKSTEDWGCGFQEKAANIGQGKGNPGWVSESARNKKKNPQSIVSFSSFKIMSYSVHHIYWASPGEFSGKEPVCQCCRHKRSGFGPWVGTIPWGRAWQPTPVLLPGEFWDRGARWGTVHGAAKSRTWLSG